MIIQRVAMKCCQGLKIKIGSKALQLIILDVQSQKWLQKKIIKISLIKGAQIISRFRIFLFLHLDLSFSKSEKSFNFSV